MKHTSLKAKPTANVATVARMVKDMLSDYKKAKKEIIKITKRNALTVLPTFCNYMTMIVFGLYQKAYHFFLNTNEENEKKEIREQIKNIYNSVNG